MSDQYVLIPEKDFTFIRYSDNGYSKRLDFIYNGQHYQYRYNYGHGYGFAFITHYPNDNALAKPLSTSGGQRIYGTIASECTPLGSLLEHSLHKINFQKTNKP